MLDIRSAADFKAGRVLGALNIPFAEMTKRKGELEKYKDKPVIIICKTGQTAAGAANMLRKDGFSEVYRMTGGMMEWTNQGLPVTKK